MNQRRSIIILCIQLATQVCLAQHTAADFIHLSTSNGLSQNTVFDMLKDHKGFMWFATDEGLNKFDGYTFTSFKHDPANPSTISSSSVLDLLEDDEHNFWVLTGNGLDRFDRITETFIHYNAITNNTIFTCIEQDNKKRLWLGTYSRGLCLFDPQKNIVQWFAKSDKKGSGPSDNYIYEIATDNEACVWIGNRGGLNKYNPATNVFTSYQPDASRPGNIAPGYVRAVFKDSRGSIWAGTQGGGVSVFNPTTNLFTNFKHDPKNLNSLSHNDILSFTEDTNGNVWIGTENGGISVLNFNTYHFINYKHDADNGGSVSGNSIHSLYKDDVGNVWAGTWSGGVSMLPFYKKKFTHYKKISNNPNSLTNNLVLSINGDDKNNVWIGTDGGGLDGFNTITHQFTHYESEHKPGKLFNNYVVDVLPYSPGVLALSFHRGGLDFFDISKRKSAHYRPLVDLPNRNSELSIRSIYKDKRNNLWMSNDGTGGIFLFDTLTKKFISFTNNPSDTTTIASHTVYTFFEDQSGQFWIGGDLGLELFDRDTKKFVLYKHDPARPETISSGGVLCLTEDKEGNLWVGTEYGLNFYNKKTKQFKHWTQKNGLPNNVILAILLAKNGDVWLSTNKGLSKLDPLTQKVRNFTIDDGLQNNTFHYKAAFQAQDGEMFFGGDNGFNTFYPDSLKDNDFVPPVYITGFEIFNKPFQFGDGYPVKESIAEAKEITLNYSQSVFTLSFAALNFTHPEQNKYAYMLEGFDEDWSYVGTKRSATYTNLNPGTYYFKVKGSNNDGIWNEKGITIKIVILPPFWLTWWFITLVLTLVAAGIAALYRFKMALVNKQKILLELKVQEQTLQLLNLNQEERNARLEAERSRTAAELAGIQVNRTNKDLQLKIKELEQFAYVASHDLQEPLRTTSGFVDLLLRHFKNNADEKVMSYLTFIADASNRMKTLIKDLLDFSRIGASVKLVETDSNEIVQTMLKDISAAVNESGAIIECGKLPVLVAYPTELKLLFQNLVVNAIKFRKKAVAPLIKVDAKPIGDYWEFSVSDNGIGIEKEHTQRIFDIFQRLHTRTEYEGSGIGLSHCKKIAELHHGKIWVSSQPGEGSTFYFTILIQPLSL